MILIGAVLASALVLWMVSRALIPDEGSMLRITVDNEVYGEYPLDQDQTIAINDTNICEIRDGKAKMIKADCPDHLCIKTAAVTKTAGRSYACRTGYFWRSYIRRIRMQFRMQSHPDGERL